MCNASASRVSVQAKVIKLADRCDNLRDLDPECDSAKNYYNESIDLAVALLMPLPKITDPNYAYVEIINKRVNTLILLAKGLLGLTA